MAPQGLKHDGVNYRILYFFHGRTTAVLSHGLVKQRANVPRTDIELAVRRRFSFEADPHAHTSRWTSS